MNKDELEAYIEELKDEIAELRQAVMEKDSRIDTLADALDDIYALARKVL